MGNLILSSYITPNVYELVHYIYLTPVSMWKPNQESEDAKLESSKQYEPRNQKELQQLISTYIRNFLHNHYTVNIKYPNKTKMHIPITVSNKKIPKGT